MSETAKQTTISPEEALMRAADVAFPQFEQSEVDKYSKDVFDHVEGWLQKQLRDLFNIATGKKIPHQAIRYKIIDEMNIKTGRYHNGTDISCPYHCWPEPPIFENPPEPPPVGLKDVVEELRKGRESTERRAEAEARAQVKPKGNLHFEWLEESQDDWREWLIVGVIGKGEFSMWFGEPSAGKSTVIGNLAFHVAYGSEFLGFRLDSCPVVYFAAERHKMVKRRLRGLRDKYGTGGLRRLGVVDGALDIRNPNDVAKFIDGTRRVADEAGEPVGLIIIDTYSRAMGGGNENAPEDGGAAVMNIQLIINETGAHVLVIHHVGTKPKIAHAAGRASLALMTRHLMSRSRRESLKSLGHG
jgi:succinate dehydrogenase flavin-adding protein (antitoxin of CptAB toxin-antitoxin module)